MLNYTSFVSERKSVKLNKAPWIKRFRAMRKGKKMTDNNVAERVKKIIVEHLGVEADKVQDGASFIDDLGADSLDVVDMLMTMEDEFGILVPDEDVVGLKTVRNVAQYIESHT